MVQSSFNGFGTGSACGAPASNGVNAGHRSRLDGFLARGKMAREKFLSANELAAATAEKIFGWKDIREQDGELVGKKRDRAGRWRTAKVPAYASDPAHGGAIEERVKQLGRWQRYQRELSRLTKENNLPVDWATPEQRSKAAIKAIGS